MPRPFGVGQYGRHAYSTGTYVYPVSVGDTDTSSAEGDGVLHRQSRAVGLVVSEAYGIPLVLQSYQATGVSSISASSVSDILRQSALEVSASISSGEGGLTRRIIINTEVLNVVSEAYSIPKINYNYQAAGESYVSAFSASDVLRQSITHEPTSVSNGVGALSKDVFANAEVLVRSTGVALEPFLWKEDLTDLYNWHTQDGVGSDWILQSQAPSTWDV